MNDADLAKELSEALDRMITLTCWSMLPLWLDASQKQRSKLAAEPVALDAPNRLRKPLSDSSRSKYKALACWRHGVLWKRIENGEVPAEIDAPEEEIERFPEDAITMEAIYFKSCPDEAPFSYSRKKFASPLLDENELTEDEIIRASVRACWASLRILQLLWKDEEGGPISDFLKLAIKYKSLDDLLKFKDVRKKPHLKWARSWPHEEKS